MEEHYNGLPLLFRDSAMGRAGGGDPSPGHAAKVSCLHSVVDDTPSVV